MTTLQDNFEERLPDSPPSGFDSSSERERTPSPTPSYHTNIHHHTPRSSRRTGIIRRPPLPVPSAALSINTSLNLARLQVEGAGNTVNFPRKPISESEKLEATIQAMRVVERNRDTFGGGNTDDTGAFLDDGLDEGVPTYEPLNAPSRGEDANLMRGVEARKDEDRKDRKESEQGGETRRREPVLYRTHPPSTGGNAGQESSSYRNVDSWRRGEVLASEHGQILRPVTRSTSMASMGMSSPTSTTRSGGSTTGSSMSTSTYGMSSAELAQHHLREAEKHLAAARLMSVVEEPQNSRTPPLPPPTNRQTDSTRFSIDSYDSRYNGNGTTIDDHTSITGNNGSSWDAASVQDHALIRKRDHYRESPDLREFEMERSEGDEVDSRYLRRNNGSAGQAPPSKPYRQPTPPSEIDSGRNKYDEDYSYYGSNKPSTYSSSRSTSNVSNNPSGQMESPSTFLPSLYGGGARGVASQFQQKGGQSTEGSQRTILEEEPGEEDFAQTTSDQFDIPPHSLPTPPPTSNTRQRLPLPPQAPLTSNALSAPLPPSSRQQQSHTAPVSTMRADDGIHGFKPRLGPTWAPPQQMQQQLHMNGYPQLQGGFYTPGYGPPPQFSTNPYQAPQYPQQYPQHNPYPYLQQQQSLRQTTLPPQVHYPPLQFNHQVPYGGVHQAHTTYSNSVDPSSQLLPPPTGTQTTTSMTMEQLSRPGSVLSDKSGSSGNNTFGRGNGGSNDGASPSTSTSSFGLRGTMKSLKGKLSHGGMKSSNSRSGMNERGVPGVVPYVSGSTTSVERAMSPHVRFKSPGPEDSQAFPALSSKAMESLGPEERKLLALKRKKVAGSIENSFGMLM